MSASSQQNKQMLASKVICICADENIAVTPKPGFAGIQPVEPLTVAFIVQRLYSRQDT